MAVDNITQRSIFGMMQALFDAAPGAGIYTLLAQSVEQGMGVPLLTNTLVKTSLFNSRYTYSDTLSVSDFAVRFVNDLVGNLVTSANKALLVSFVVTQVNNGMSRSDAISTVIGALSGVPNTDPSWGGAAARYKQEAIGVIVDNLLGSSSNIAAIKTQVAKILSDAVTQDMTPLGNLVATLISIIDTTPESDALLGGIAHRFHNKLEVSQYYSLNLQQSATSIPTLHAIISRVDANDTTVSLAKMTVDYYAAHPPYASDTLVVSASADISGIDTAQFKKLIITSGPLPSNPRAIVTMTAAQAVAFGANVTKGTGDQLAITDTLANIIKATGQLPIVDRLAVIVSETTDLSKSILPELTGLMIDDGTGKSITVTINATQASALFGNITKGANDRLAVIDAVADILATPNLAYADNVTGVVSASTDLSTTDLSKLTDLKIDSGSVDVTLHAAQADILNGHITKGAGSKLTLYVVPSDISSSYIQSIADAIICYVAINFDLRTLNLNKVVGLKISDDKDTGITATLLAAQTNALAGRVTKGVADRLVVDDTPTQVVAAADLSEADAVYANELKGNKVTISEKDLARITALHTTGETTLTGVTTDGLPQDLAKTTVTGSKLLIQAAPADISVSQTLMARIASLTAQPGYAINLTSATSAGWSPTIVLLHVSDGGLINVSGATGENFVVSEPSLASVGWLAAALNASIFLTDASGSALADDLAKLKVSGTGKVSVTGADNESFTMAEDKLLVLKSLTANGTGAISVTGVHNAKLATVLGVTAIAGTGGVNIIGADGESLTITQLTLQTEPVISVTAANNQNITLSDARNASLTGDATKLHVSGTGKIYANGAQGEHFVLSETNLAPIGLLTAASDSNIALTEVTNDELFNDLAKLKVSGSGKVSITGAENEDFNMTEDKLLTLGALTATGLGSIAVTNVHSAKLAAIFNITSIAGTGGLSLTGASTDNLVISQSLLLTEAVTSITAATNKNITLSDARTATLMTDTAMLHVSGSGKVNVSGAVGENFVMSETGLASIGTLTAAQSANISLIDVTNAGLTSDLSKIKVSGAGVIYIAGVTNESFNVTEDTLLSMKTLTVSGTGSITVTDVRNVNMVADLNITTVGGTGGLSLVGATGEHLTVSQMALQAERINSVTAAINKNITLSDADAATFTLEILKLHVSGTGSINLIGASGQNFSFTEMGLSGYGSISSTGAGSINVTSVTAGNLLNDLAKVSGNVILTSAGGQSFTLTHSQVPSSLNSFITSVGDSVTLNGATGATVMSDISKFNLTGGGTLDIFGATSEHLTIPAASMASIRNVYVAGNGNLSVPDAVAANVGTLLPKLASISGSGAVSVTFTDAATASVSAAAANGRQIIANNPFADITITNASGKQVFYASPGINGFATIITKTGDSTPSALTCDVLNLVTPAATIVDLSAISALDAMWNTTTSATATALNGAGLVLDPAKYDTYVASISGSNYVVYETAVNGAATGNYEAVRIVGTVTPAALHMGFGLLYLG